MKNQKVVSTFRLCLSLPTDAIFTLGVEPPKYGRMDMFHLDRLRSICARAKNPTKLVEGKSLDEYAHYTRHRLSQKGKHLSDQIQVSHCYAESLCHIYDFTCCSKIDHKHLPF